MDAATVRAIADSVLDGADLLDQIDWPTIDSNDMVGSSALQSAASSLTEERLADVVAHMRTWAVAAQASAAAIHRAEARQAGRLGAPR